MQVDNATCRFKEPTPHPPRPMKKIIAAFLVFSSITRGSRLQLCLGKPAGCPDNGSGWAFFTGTSMATPHIAGGAAVLLQLHEDWTPAQIKSALVNHADLVVKDAVTGTHGVGPTLQGGGRENLSVAADATTWLDSVSAS